MLHYISLPTWLTVRAAVPLLPEGHPLYGTRIELRYWNRTQTWLARLFDVIMWVDTLSIVLLLTVV